jgi:hypothetical protein
MEWKPPASMLWVWCRGGARHVTDAVCSLGVDLLAFVARQSRSSDAIVRRLASPGVFILVDYVSLVKTRLILHILPRLRYNLIAIVILGIDYCVYTVFFATAILLLVDLSWYLSFRPEVSLWDIVSGFSFDESTFRTLFFLPYIVDVLFSFFWAGFVPSMWMWLYVGALFVTRGLFRSERLVNWLRWALNVEKAPFRSIGAVAATLAFIASVAIILVSVEVSRINAAS